MMNYSKNTKLNSKRIITAKTAVAIVILLMVLVAACNATDNKDTETTTAKPTAETVTSTEGTTTEPPTTEETTSSPYIAYLGKYKLTAYCGCSICCGQWGENRPIDEHGKTIVYTASGVIAEEGVTIAADLDVLPYGTEVYILGHKYTVQDKDGAVTGNTIDIYFENHQDAVDFGVQYQDVYLGSEVETDD